MLSRVGDKLRVQVLGPVLVEVDGRAVPLRRPPSPSAGAGPAGAAGESIHAIDTGEEQHARIEQRIAGARAGLNRWARENQAVTVLAERLTALEPHLRGEERDVLPRIAPRAYARLSRRVHGTARP
jgi:hypothetical protein